MLNDLQYAIRMLAKNSGFTVVAVLTLALGIGANTTIFSFVSASLLRPLPYKEPGRLVMLWATNLQQGVTRDVTSYPDFMDWKNQSHAFESMAALRGQTFNLSGGSQPERVGGLRVSSEFFTVFGISVAQGRGFLPEESQPGKNRIAVLSDRLWQRRFGRDPSWLGKTLRLNDEGYTIVGVLPSGFDFFRNGAEVYVPLTPDSSRCTGYLEVIGRVKADVSLQQAQSEQNLIADRLWQQYPWECRGGGIRVETLQDSMIGDDKPSLFIIMGAVGFVLLIACANVANLLLARALARQKEFAVRSTLGAGRWRIVRQLLVESVLVGLLGGILGVLLAFWGVDLLSALLFGNLPLPQTAKFDIDVRVLGFALLLSMLTGVIFGLAPALGISQPVLNESLKEGGRSHTGGVRRNRLRSLLVVSEVTLAFVLLMGAGLMIKSFLRLQRVNPGLYPENILTMNFALSKVKYSQTHLPGTFFQQVLERLGKIPGVQSAATIMDVPLGGSETHLDVRAQGHIDASEKPFQAGFNLVSPNYFRTMGIPLKQGRDVTESDGPRAPGVAIINETMARHFWPNEEPIGRQIMIGDGVKFGPWLSVVGVVADVKHLGLDKPVRAAVFIPHLQDPYILTEEVAWMALVVRTTADPTRLVGSVKDAVWSIDRNQPISDIQTMEQILARSVAQPRVLTLLFGTFASLALILALGGIYGVMSYSAAQRTHEIGIRVALGAQQNDILKLVLGQGMGLTLLGVIIGLTGALALTRVIANFLFGVAATDPITFLGVSALLFSVALLASYIPARRATKVDPLAALRYE